MTEIHSAWPTPSGAWFAVAVLAVAAVLSYTDRQILGLLVDPIRADLAISDSQIGVLQGIAPPRARGLAASFIAFGNIMLGLGVGATLTGIVTDRVFGDPLAVGKSLTLVVVPAGIAAIALFFLAARAARSLTP